jgi:D-serine dehydratase
MTSDASHTMLTAAPPAQFAALRRGDSAVWMRRPGLGLVADALPLRPEEVRDAEARLTRFEPLLRSLFPGGGWDGRIRSPLIDYPERPWTNGPLLLKGDHALPMTGSVKARGGVHEVLCHLEDLAVENGLWAPGRPIDVLLEPAGRALFERKRIVVASTGNLGFSIGLVSRAFGLQAEIHMSQDAKAWKKDRLRALGAVVVEHACDYTEAVARARQAADAGDGYFIDDEYSRRLFVGYATAARELAAQLAERGIEIGAGRPLVVYLPCGVGGAPGGIAAGLKAIYGADFLAVFVEPVASACVFAALAAGGGEPVSVYDIGLDNDTIADGLAVPTASRLVLRTIGGNIDAVVAVRDREMIDGVQRAWADAGLRLEPSAASSLAAIPHFHEAAREAGFDLGVSPVQVAWATGGALLPDAEFAALLADRPL